MKYPLPKWVHCMHMGRNSIESRTHNMQQRARDATLSWLQWESAWLATHPCTWQCGYKQGTPWLHTSM